MYIPSLICMYVTETKKDKKKRREEEEDFELSTDEEAFAGASDAEKGYDSDRDPGWMPGKEVSN